MRANEEAAESEDDLLLSDSGEEQEEVDDDEDSDIFLEEAIAEDEIARPVEGARVHVDRNERLRKRLLREAKELYEEALRLDPWNSYAVNGLTLFVVSRLQKREMLEKAVELDGENPYALSNLGSELLGEDDERSLKYVQKALEINPRLFYARHVKCKVLLRMGDLPGALNAAREQLEWQPNDEMAVRFLEQLEFRLELVRQRRLFG